MKILFLRIDPLEKMPIKVICDYMRKCFRANLHILLLPLCNAQIEPIAFKFIFRFITVS